VNASRRGVDAKRRHRAAITCESTLHCAETRIETIDRLGVPTPIPRCLAWNICVVLRKYGCQIPDVALPGVDLRTRSRAPIKTHLTGDNVYINCVIPRKISLFSYPIRATRLIFAAFPEKIFFTLPPTHTRIRETAARHVDSTSPLKSPNTLSLLRDTRHAIHPPFYDDDVPRTDPHMCLPSQGKQHNGRPHKTPCKPEKMTQGNPAGIKVVPFAM